jgi:ribonucleoside-diphosphate reductase alpha chain
MITLDRNTAEQEALRWFGGDHLRATTYLEKYALHAEDGTVLEPTPPLMWDRVAREIASVEPDDSLREHWRREFRWLLDGFRFLPGGRIMHGAGNPSKITLLNCYFCAIRGDSIEAIYDAAYRAARTYSRGGGVGIDITPLRPRGAPVHNAARTSTGAVSFMELFSLTTGLIGQEGRRGALMITIADHHPDVLDFCRIKRDLTSVRYANISVRLSDPFMRAVERDEPWTLWFEGPEVGRIERTIRARDLWKELVEGARDWAEPGCLFWDRVVGWGTSNYGGMTPQGTNPCSEIPLEDGGACDLGSLNLSRFVLDPFTPQARIDFDSLRRAVRAGVRFLDNVLTYNEGKHPLPEQEEAARRGRRIGLGITGLGDALIMLGLRYDSDEAIRTAGELQELIKLEAYRASVELAREKGPFPAFDPEKHLSQAFFSTFPDHLLQEIRRHGLRNVSLLTIPPVGSGSALAGCTNGLEPIFALYYVRRSESLSREYYTVLHPLVAEYARMHGLDLKGLQDTSDPHGYLKSKLPAHFVTAHEIDPIKRVDMQAALQRHIDQSISSTVNLPREATAETVERVYFHAWKAGLKGISVYREGSREGVLLTPEEARRRHQLVALADRVDSLARAAIPDLPTDGAAGPEQRIEATVRALADALEAVRKQAPEQLELISNDASLLRDRPRVLSGPTYRVPTQFGTLFVTITERDGEPYEVFVRLGKGGSDTEAFAEAVGRLSSVILRMKGPGSGSRRLLELVYHQLEGIGGRTSYGFGPNRIRSVPDAIAAGLRAYLQDRGLLHNGNGHAEETAPQAHPPTTSTRSRGADICPRCHEMTLVVDEGCARCVCGYKEC